MDKSIDSWKVKHGHFIGTKKCSKTYMVWSSMKSRCNNKNHHAYNSYGGRNIKICNRWNDYVNFLEDMGDKPEGLSLDRIDNNGDYSLDNCRWATRSEQQRNKKNTRLNEIAVKVIRYMFEVKGYGHTRIGRAMNLTREHIRDIVTYRIWREV